jgi:hypothetical protein
VIFTIFFADGSLYLHLLCFQALRVWRHSKPYDNANALPFEQYCHFAFLLLFA